MKGFHKPTVITVVVILVVVLIAYHVAFGRKRKEAS